MTRHTVDRQEKNLLARVVFRTACFVDRLSLEPRGGILQGWICDSCKGRTVPSRERKNTMARFFQHVLLFSVGYRPEWTTPNTEPHKVRAGDHIGFCGRRFMPGEESPTVTANFEKYNPLKQR
jgi:hypothetical protein